MKILKYLLSFLCNEYGKGGGSGETTSTTKSAPLTPEEEELNRMQIARAREAADRALALHPQRRLAMQANINLAKKKIASQQEGMKAVSDYLAGTDLSRAREQLQNEIIQDTIDKIKGKKSYVSDQEKEKLKGLESAYKTEGGQQIQSLADELNRLTSQRYSTEGLRSGGLYSRLVGQEAGYQTATLGRAGGILGAQTLMNLPTENRMNLANQLESAQRLGQQARWGQMNILSTATGGMGGGGMSSAGGGIAAGGGSLSGTLAKMDQARRDAAKTTQTQDPLSKSDMATQGAIAGGQAGMGIGTAAGAGIGAMVAKSATTGASVGGVYGAAIGAIIGIGLGAIYGYNS